MSVKTPTMEAKIPEKFQQLGAYMGNLNTGHIKGTSLAGKNEQGHIC